MIPRGIRAPSSRNRSGVRRNSIVSVSSSLASSQPATSARVTPVDERSGAAADDALSPLAVAGRTVVNREPTSRVPELCRPRTRIRRIARTATRASGKTTARIVRRGSLAPGPWAARAALTACHASVVRRSPCPRFASASIACALVTSSATRMTCPSRNLASRTESSVPCSPASPGGVRATTSPASMCRCRSAAGPTFPRTRRSALAATPHRCVGSPPARGSRPRR